MAQVDGLVESGRDELLGLIEREWAEWEELIARAEGRLTEPGACGTWSFKDVIAHVTAYQRFGAELVGADVRHVEVPQEIGLDFQRRNEWFHEQDRDRSLEDVLAEARQVHRELVERVRAMLPAELRAQPVGWFAWPAWRWLIHLTHEHYPEHVPGLRAWLGLEGEKQ
jgi:hypothetical protein